MSSEKREQCGLFGIFGDQQAVQKTYYGLFSLQHRGDDSIAALSTSPRLRGEVGCEAAG